MSQNIGIIILAAGKGQRFQAAGGQGNKLLAPYPNAAGQLQPLLALTLQQARDSGLPSRIVTRPNQRDIIMLAQQFGAEVSLLASGGSGDSIAAGVAASGAWNGWLIVPGDMGWIQAADYQQVAQALRHEQDQARMSWQQLPGHPVGFGRRYYQGLCNLHGDAGARQLLLADKLQYLPGHAGVIRDADLPPEQLPAGPSC